MKTLRAAALAAICAVLTGCAGSHGTTASTPLPDKYQRVVSTAPPAPQMRHGVRPPRPDPLRETWSHRGYTTVLADTGTTLFLSGRPGTVRIARASEGLQWFTAMSCTAGVLSSDALYAACGGRIVKVNASTGETIQRSAAIPFGVTALSLAGAHAIAINPAESETSSSPTRLFLDRDTLKPWTPKFGSP